MCTENKLGVNKFKMLSYVFIFLISFIQTSCNAEYQKLSESEVNKEDKLLAERIANKILQSQKEGKFEPLGEEATEAMRTGLNPQKQKESYETIKGMFGDFQSLEYVETWVPNDGSLLVIYRFNGNFNSKAKPEIRVVMDGNKKFSGFWILPWKDKM